MAIWLLHEGYIAEALCELKLSEECDPDSTIRKDDFISLRSDIKAVRDGAEKGLRDVDYLIRWGDRLDVKPDEVPESNVDFYRSRAREAEALVFGAFPGRVPRLVERWKDGKGRLRCRLGEGEYAIDCRWPTIRPSFARLPLKMFLRLGSE